MVDVKFQGRGQVPKSKRSSCKSYKVKFQSPKVKFQGQGQVTSFSPKVKFHSQVPMSNPIQTKGKGQLSLSWSSSNLKAKFQSPKVKFQSHVPKGQVLRSRSTSKVMVMVKLQYEGQASMVKVKVILILTSSTFSI